MRAQHAMLGEDTKEAWVTEGLQFSPLLDQFKEPLLGRLVEAAD